MNITSTSIIFFLVYFLISINTYSQNEDIKWDDDGSSYFKSEQNEIIKYTLPDNEARVIISLSILIPKGSDNPLIISFFSISPDHQKVLLFTNTRKVWRLRTRGDYWIYDLNKDTLYQLGKTLPKSSLMFAKFSPDCKSVAYVSLNNIYTEDLTSLIIKKMTEDGMETSFKGRRRNN